MKKEASPSDDLRWEAAWEWLQRQHETGFENPEFNAELNAWLKADPANRTAYDKAAQIWLFAGFVPPLDNTAPPSGCSDPANE